MKDGEPITRRADLFSQCDKAGFSRGSVSENSGVVCHRQVLAQFGSPPTHLKKEGCLDPALVPQWKITTAEENPSRLNS